MNITQKDRKEVKKVLKNLGRRKRKETVFYDLCFCLCAPQCKFENNIKVIAKLKECNFYYHGIVNLNDVLKPVRFYNNKARYLSEAKKNFNEILENIKPVSKDDCGYAQREWLVKNVKGMGMKAASHFLRNQGYDALAIIDIHILKYLVENTRGCTDWGKELNRLKQKASTLNGYEDIEMNFQCIAGSYDLTTAELDALIWKQRSGTDWKAFKY